MAEDGESIAKQHKKTQDAFQELQEVPTEHRFPVQSGIVEIPRGSRGPRSLYIPRKDDSFGFKLRHLIVYPPQEEDRHARPNGDRLQHMETIFVRSIVEGGPAEIAGLRVGDRLVAVNGKPVTDKPYGEVVNYIQQSPGYLHLLVISKEEDIIQKFYKEFAYNPVTNQQEHHPQQPRRSLIHHQQYPQQLATYPRRPPDSQADSISWRSLQNTNYNSLEQARLNPRQPRQQRSADNILNPTPQRTTQRAQQQVINDAIHFRPRAQPQVPAQRKMGRRASEGSSYAEREIYEQIVNNSGDMVVGDSNGAKMKTATKGGFESTHHPSLDMTYSQVPGCRLSLDDERRDSNSSLTSADGSKDSLNSYDSSSTITGGYRDIEMDKTMMSRIIRSLQKKEEFLKADSANGPKEFYGRPQRFEKPIWPPPEPRNESPSRTLKPTHQNFQRVKNDIDSERDYIPPQPRASSVPKDMPYGAQEACVAPSMGIESHINGANENLDFDDKRNCPLQIVQTRAKQFESGRPLPEDDPLNDRTSFYRSELARVSEKRVVPSVTVRAREYETRGGAPDSKKEASAPILRKNHRDSRSLDSSDTSTLEENSPNRMRNRSNSADSWVLSPIDGGLQLDNGRLGNGLDVTTKRALEDRPLVVRRTKNTNLAEEERAMRRESYLKATEGGRMPFDSDFSDGDMSPHVLRSGSVSGGSSNSSVSLDREKRPSSPTEKQNVIREGSLHCKITEIDGKRSADRSWKQLWVVLKGPKLYLYKDKHHLSPVGTSDVAEQSLASGIDMRASCVGIPENYTKRKHVLRVSSVVPCRSEILLQADNPVELAEWVKCLQDQVAANDEEYKTEQFGPSKQQAVPQTIPASTSIQVQGSSRLSPQTSNKSKLSNLRNRSPTGHSPVSKNRKPVQLNEAATSPKSKTWRGRVAKQFRKIQGASSPTSPTAPEAATFGVPLDHCQPSNYNQFVPRLVEACTEIIEGKGLETIGIYRVPGNNAAVSALTEEANKCYDELTHIDPRWNDVHVVSSLLKSFFRRMPDSLLTAHLYPKFIEADKIDDTIKRLEQIKKLIKMLPPHHYHTLKHVIFHLKRVVDNCNMNKMEAKNLAIVFGPTIVRAGEESMELMVNNMTHQCKIVESLLVYADWFFNESTVEQLNICAPMATSEVPENEQINTNLLLDNISKVEGLREQKDKKEFIHSLISAAQRKVGKRKPTKSQSCSNDSKDEPSTPNGVKEFTSRSFDVTDFKENVMDEQKSYVPTTVTDLEQSTRPYFNYKMDRDTVQQRIKNFIQETEANLSARKSQTFSLDRRAAGPISSSASNVSQTPALSLATDPQDRTITKTHSASNVYSRTTNSDNVRNSLSSTDNYKVQYPGAPSGKHKHFGNYNRNSDQIYDKRRQPSDNQSSCNDLSAVRIYNTSPTGYGMRKGNSAENLNNLDVSNGNLKKIKYENECDVGQRTGSLDSLNKIEEDGDLVKTMTKIFDEKKKELTTTPLLNDIDLPYVDDSPEKIKSDRVHNLKPAAPGSPKLYRDPSLHKSQYSTKFNKEDKENVDKEKDEDSTMIQDENIPDNERNITKKINIKLKRSESLNKPERTSPLTIKLKRSESLNKSSDRLKRSDSLTKTEKTESNLSKRASSSRRGKEFTKLKRKNGMPERSIKRRHTVGGTKDPDKVTWLDNRNHRDESNAKEANERNLRTSSPDLSTSRKDRLLLQFNFEIAPEEMVAAFKKHFIGARPQSFPESSVYNVPLESHV